MPVIVGGHAYLETCSIVQFGVRTSCVFFGVALVLLVRRLGETQVHVTFHAAVVSWALAWPFQHALGPRAVGDLLAFVFA